MGRLHNYVYGEPVRVQTDHKPLETIWNKRAATARPRLQRLLLRLATNEIQFEYISGKDNSITDALSRADSLCPEPQDSKQMDAIPVHQITNTILATDNRLDRTKFSITADPTLNQLRHYIFHGCPHQKCQLPQPVQHYWNYIVNHIAESRISERSSHRALRRGENSTKSTLDSVLARNL